VLCVLCGCFLLLLLLLLLLLKQTTTENTESTEQRREEKRRAGQTEVRQQDERQLRCMAPQRQALAHAGNPAGRSGRPTGES
jgi:cytochrome c-type biogenesis protein CcmH/NrfF